MVRQEFGTGGSIVLPPTSWLFALATFHGTERYPLLEPFDLSFHLSGLAEHGEWRCLAPTRTGPVQMAHPSAAPSAWALASPWPSDPAGPGDAALKTMEK